MTKIGFLIALLITIQATNIRNSSKGTEDNLVFTRGDSFIIFGCFLSACLIDLLSYLDIYLYIVGGCTALYFLLFIIINAHREKIIKDRKDNIIQVYEACSDILGKVNKEEIDFDNTPFQLEKDEKTDKINKIVFDTTHDGKFNDNTITLCQYSLNKFFPNFQWTSVVDYPKREVSFYGLPKPPDIADFPGSDYRPTGWIPLGVSGQGEIGWNLSGPKDIGTSSFLDKDNKVVGSVDLPSAPQALTVGSTGGGKSVWVEQEVEIL